jgi:hypothetical protein
VNRKKEIRLLDSSPWIVPPKYAVFRARETEIKSFRESEVKANKYHPGEMGRKQEKYEE